MAFLQANSLLVAAYPVHDSAHIARDEAQPVSLDEAPGRRTIIVVFCIGYVFLLALAQGYRAGRMAGRKTSAKFSDILVFAQGFVSTAFVFAVGINSAGLGLQTDEQCHAAIRVCIAMYGAAKIALYLFLLERVHVVRAPFIDRIRDPVWVIGAILTVGGFAGIIGFEFIAPRADLSRVDGVCRIGIQPDSGIAVIALDTTINLGLTGIFVWQLLPALGSSIVPWRHNHMPDSSSRSRRWPFIHSRGGQSNYQERSSAWLASQRNLKVMLFRNVIGTGLLLVATITNNVLFLTWSFAIYSHACQLLCLTDVVLGMLVTNWLTMRSISVADSTSQTASTSGMASAISRRPTYEFGKELEEPKAGVTKPTPTNKMIRA